MHNDGRQLLPQAVVSTHTGTNERCKSRPIVASVLRPVLRSGCRFAAKHFPLAGPLNVGGTHNTWIRRLHHTSCLHSP